MTCILARAFLKAQFILTVLLVAFTIADVSDAVSRSSQDVLRANDKQAKSFVLPYKQPERVLTAKERITKTGAKQIQVEVASFFRLVFDDRNQVFINPGELKAVGARITEFYDLENDPLGRFNLNSPTHDLIGDGLHEGHLLLLENSPVRVIIENKGFLCSISDTSAAQAKSGSEVVRRYVIYPTGQIYVRQTHSNRPSEFHIGPHLNSAGSFSAADQHVDPGPQGEFLWQAWGGKSYLSSKDSPFAMFHSNAVHPENLTPGHGLGRRPVFDVKADVLVAFHFLKGKVYYRGRWAHQEKQGDVMMSWLPIPSWDLPDSQTYTFLLQIKPNTMNDNRVVLPYVDDYRNPASLEFIRGRRFVENPDDLNKDGYNEAEGCYVMAADGGVDFYLDGSRFPRFNPVFKVRNWTSADVPTIISIDGRRLQLHEHYIAAISNGTLLLQYIGEIGSRRHFVIGNPESG